MSAGVHACPGMERRVRRTGFFPGSITENVTL
jgi:hypothetical protein